MSAVFNNYGFIVRNPEFQYVTLQNQCRPMCRLQVCFDTRIQSDKFRMTDKPDLCLNVSFWDEWAEHARDHLHLGVRIQVEGELKLDRDANGMEYTHIKGKCFSIDASLIKEVLYSENLATEIEHKA